jgi:hypothetical protein
MGRLIEVRLVKKMSSPTDDIPKMKRPPENEKAGPGAGFCFDP